MYPAGPDWWIDQFAEVQLDRGSLDQVDGDQAEQPEDRPSRRRLRDRAGRAGGHARNRRAAPRVRGRQVRRHLRRQHRAAAEEGHAAALRHALLRDRLRAAQQDDDRVQVLPEGRRRRNTRCARRPSATSRTTSSRCRRTPWSAPTATSGCRAPARIDAFQPHMHMRGTRHDGRSDRSGDQPDA